ncbi:MAG: hypothetical protein J07HX64_02914 [halophilic archaeon J07HX64]|jgi:hypothetical protein|nr:MAG: hypothetical protein J07HX64_02914 [halophilic archaeon J07HX64]
MRDRTRWVLYESAVSLFASAVGVGLLVAIYSHLWLDASEGATEQVLRLSDSVVVARPTVESLRLVGAAATAVGLGLLAVLSPGYAQFADDLQSEARAGLVAGVLAGLAGGALAVVAPTLAMEALGLTLLACGLLVTAVGVTLRAVTSPV